MEEIRHRLNVVGAWLAALTRREPFLMSFLYVVLFCAFSMVFLDRPLALYFKNNVSVEVNGFFKTVTGVGDSLIFLIPAAAIWIFLRVKERRSHKAAERLRLRRWSYLPLFMVASIAASGIVVNILKFLIGRYRPRYLFESGLYGFQPFNTQWGMNSFPSGHSQAIWSAMMALMFIFPRYDLLWIVMAVLVSLSRMITTVHYLSDVVFGSYLAIITTILVRREFIRRGIDLQVKLPRDARLF